MHIVLVQRYRLLRQIGKHGSTESWEAYDTRLERPVAAYLLSEQSREDEAAAAQLRQAARQPALDAGQGAPRVLDGGDDPTYGPFVVAELTADLERTRRLPVIPLPPNPAGQPTTAAPRSSPAPQSVRSPARATGERVPQARRPVRGGAPRQRGVLGMLALLAVLLLVLGSLFLLARTFGMRGTGALSALPTPEPPTRPISGAAAAQSAPKPTLVLTLAPPAASQPTRAATRPPTAQPTRQPTSPAQATSAPAQPAAPAEPAPPVEIGAADQPAAPARTVAPGQPVVPPQPTASAPTTPAGSPAETIRQHYALIDARRYADGYALMDAHLRSLNSPADYASWFANKVSIAPISIDVVSQTATQAVVRSIVQTTDRINGQDITSQVVEQFIMHPEDGAWRIAQVTRLS